MADPAVWITGTGPDKQLHFRLPTGGKGDKGDKGADGSNVLPTDTAIKNAINDPASQTRGALDGSYAKRALDGDGIPVVADTDGQTRILTPEAAANSFSPIEDSIFIPAKAFDPSGGLSPSWASIDSGNAWAWLLDDGTNASTEGVTGLFTVPDHWTKITTVEVWWVALTAAGGNVVWSMNVFDLAHSLSLTSGGDSTLNSTASSASTTANRVRVTSVTSSFTVEPIKVQRLLLRRLTTDAADTVTGDVGLIGVKIIGAAA